MKLALASDLHLEFGSINLTNGGGAEVLLLSGDILIAQHLHDHPPADMESTDPGSRQRKAQEYRNFLAEVSGEFPHVIMVAGNHEFYGGSWGASLDHLRGECSRFQNIHFLENDTKTIGDTTFIGCTLWTDMNRGDPLTLHAVRDMMNDYRAIRNDSLGYTKLRPAHTLERFRRSVEYIRTVVEGKFEDKFVVVGHHAPCTMSIHKNYRNDKLMNGAFASDLSDFIIDHPQIKIWTHGHTHHPFDYTVGSTRIVCNPRGYIGYEPGSEDFKLQYLEI